MKLSLAYQRVLRLYTSIASTKDMLAALQDLGVEVAVAERLLNRTPPALFVARPRTDAEQRAAYMAPEQRDAFPVVARYADQVVEHSITSAGSAAVVSACVKCPRCLRPDADRGDVEFKGVCLDCSLAGKSPAAETFPPPVVAVQPDAAADLAPPGDGAALAERSTGGGAVSRSAYLPEPDGGLP